MKKTKNTQLVNQSKSTEEPLRLEFRPHLDLSYAIMHLYNSVCPFVLPSVRPIRSLIFRKAESISRYMHLERLRPVG